MKAAIRSFVCVAVSLCASGVVSGPSDAGARFAGKPIVTVSGTAQLTVIPDEVVVSLGVHTENVSMSVAISENNERVARVLASIERLGIAAKDYQTDSIRVDPMPQYSFRPSQPVGYAMSKSIRITLRDASQIEPLLARVFDAGADQLYGVEFRVKDLQSHREKARLLAVRVAREKAQSMSGELGQTIGKALYIDEAAGYSPYSTGYYYGGWRGQSQSANVSVNAGGTPVETDGTVAFGQISVTARVNVVFELR